VLSSGLVLVEDVIAMDLKQGDLENIILNALWDLETEGNEKIFVSDVQEKIKTVQKKWAYTTVKTVLDRLVDKDIAQREKEGKKYYYRSVVNRDQAGVDAIQKVLRQYFKNDVDELLLCLKKISPGLATANVAPVQRISFDPEVERVRLEQQFRELVTQ
jgi:predicted transcriptional regulator